jgi:nucleotide-binding universal stress UspA family protein
MKIIATFDQSPFSEAILPLLQQIAALPEAEFVLLAVAELPGGRRRRGRSRRPAALVVNAPAGGDAFLVDAQPPTFVETKSQAINRQISELEDYLRDIAKQLPEGIPYTVEAHVGHHAAEIIVERARQEAPDVIVMATHGRTGIVRSLFGSVAEDVLRAGAAPVLLVHPEDVRLHRTSTT